ncbi:hypothetical protein H6P81_020007 [Aristolochia fimbriata]|uniref:Uncharacterized protein n=1 Tax=Aristolochia fimbriata TaxID=158543 RepID=A0AAV7DXA2_ARIFI|nr:hypothetical protein H6P81_020007 [Aristolochia fimbriata]
MGSCLSKKSTEKKKSGSDGDAAASPSPDPNLGSREASPDAVGHEKKIIVTQEEQRREEIEVKKEVPVLETPSKKIEDDKVVEQSRGNRKGSSNLGYEGFCSGGGGSGSGSAPVRTSSCTKEELDAILIQCGRLSRSSSGKGGSCGENQTIRSHRFSGSKRSYDFDDDSPQQYNKAEEEDKAHATARLPRRRTPSRERDGGGGSSSQLKRSSSYGEEGTRSRRRASRSPGRRSETPTAADNNKRPTKIVSIPATAPLKRGISASAATSSASSSYLKRGGEAVVGGVRSNASPRSRSPATTTGRSAAANENSAPQPSLSRNSSRKTEHSPFRRNPMHEIDENALNHVIKLQQPAADLCYRSNTNKMPPANNITVVEEGLGAAISHIQLSQKTNERATQMQKQHRKSSPLRKKAGIREQLISCRAAEQEPEPEINQEAADTKRGQTDKDLDVSQETHNFQKLTRSRSSRRSRDLDLLINSSLLTENSGQLEPAGFTLPACVSKACSILEAVADLNASATSTRSSVLSYNGGKFFPEAGGAHNHHPEKTILDRFGEGKFSFGKKTNPFLESEVDVTGEDLTVPSLHKYVTGRDFRSDAMDEQESAGSNTFLFLEDDDDAGAVASREPGSIDSNDRWTSLSKAIEDLGLQTSSTKAKRNWGYNKDIGVQVLT